LRFKASRSSKQLREADELDNPCKRLKVDELIMDVEDPFADIPPVDDIAIDTTADSGARLSLDLKENAEQVSRAVDTYIDYYIQELTEIQYDKRLLDSVREKMRRKANGTFLWVSLVINELKDVMSWEVL
jgi:hypothetical protein